MAMALLTLTACGGSGEGGTSQRFDGPPLASVRTAQQAYELAVRFNPEATPIRGVNAVELKVTDRDGLSREGLIVALLPWMPAMNHGSSVVPTITELGDGRYFVDRVSMFMPGRWQLRITLTDPASELADDGAIDLDVP